jgi:hypothetical protein
MMVNKLFETVVPYAVLLYAAFRDAYLPEVNVIGLCLYVEMLPSNLTHILTRLIESSRWIIRYFGIRKLLLITN